MTEDERNILNEHEQYKKEQKKRKNNEKKAKELRWKRYMEKYHELCDALFEKHIEIPLMADVDNDDLEKLLFECDEYIPELQEAIENDIYICVLGYDYENDNFEYCLR